MFLSNLPCESFSRTTRFRELAARNTQLTGFYIVYESETIHVTPLQRFVIPECI